MIVLYDRSTIIVKTNVLTLFGGILDFSAHLNPIVVL